MLDIKFIREFPDAFDTALKNRSESPLSKKILELDEIVRSLTQKLQELQQKKNDLAKKIAEKKKNNEDVSNELNFGAKIRVEIAETEKFLDEKKFELRDILIKIPNIPADDAVIGDSEKDNLELRVFGKKPEFDFEIKDHEELGENLNLLDIPRAVKLSGSRFSSMFGNLAKLERALAQFMLDTHVNEYGYVECYLPILVNENCMFGTGQLPKFEEDQFQTKTGEWLLPTAEVALTNLVRDEIIDEKKLPLRLTAYTPCFRAEAGSAGKDLRGIFRQHQFGKVELVSITTKENSKAEHLRMTDAAENILKKLNLHYRVVELCTGDMGFSSQKTYDIEVWLPSQNTFREISSCSICGDFQARRMNARYRDSNRDSNIVNNNVVNNNVVNNNIGNNNIVNNNIGNNVRNNNFVHTLNGSGLAVGRTLIAIMENYQNKNGEIIIPEVLKKYMGGIEKITKIKNIFE